MRLHRLNKQLYDAEHFKEIGIEHVESRFLRPCSIRNRLIEVATVYFDDGTNPTLEMTREFIQLAERVISAGGECRVDSSRVLC